MEVNELPQFDPNVDYRAILPIHQKRTIAFLNHFITNTVTFLNQFAESCESRLLDFEYKIQKVEASLLILESQLSSIPETENDTSSTENPIETTNDTINLSSEVLDLPVISTEEIDDVDNEPSQVSDGSPQANVDPRFSKFFKMVQFGVPPQAVKLKMVAEGIDPNILDKPHEIFPGYNPLDFKNDSYSSTDSN